MLLKCPVFYITKSVKVSEKIVLVRSNIRNASDINTSVVEFGKIKEMK